MIKYALCLLALAACGLPEKTHCTTASDCLDGEACIAEVCQSSNHDACGPSHARCADDAVCSETAGALACTCNTGFAGDGVSCADVDECTAQASPCGAHATCTNSPGAFSCACDAGFIGDGTSCAPGKFTKIAAAGGFTCGLASSGGIFCWGQNAFGDLGDGTLAARSHPVQVGSATDWIDVDARTNVGCGLRADHSMWCWGFGTSGQLGDGKLMIEHTPVQVISDKPGVGWKAMALGRQTVCAVHDDSSVACWGLDRVGGRLVGAPVAVDANTDWTDLAAGTVTCGIRGTGQLYCWGKSTSGQLGLGAITSQATPAQVGTDTWKRVRVGFDNTCGIRSDGALLCWGNSPFTVTALQYGNTPQQIGTATDWQAISLAAESIIGLRAGGFAYAWGGNESGQLGVPLTPEVVEPSLLSGTVTSWSQVSAGNVHGCGLADGQAYCWGEIADGFLGDGSSTTLYSPTRIGNDHFTALAGGPGTCALRSDGALICWGDAFTGVGFGNTDPVWTPTRLGTDTWTGIAGSSDFQAPAACAIRVGQPYCWGDNSSGQLGIGNVNTPQLSPVAVNVPSGKTWTELTINSHTCAITSDAALYCWGRNDFGQLGTGAAPTAVPTTAPGAPLPGVWLHVAGASTVLSDSMTCGIRTDHTLWCWGRDQFPDTTQHLVPTQVGSESSWQSLSMASHAGSAPTTCAIKLDGSLWCWGARLGDGTTNTSPTPVRVGTDNDWKSVNVGGEICAIKTGGTLWCWGNSSVLGDGTPVIFDDPAFDTSTRVPTKISSDTDWSAVATDPGAGAKSCALKTDGSLWCWGSGAAPVPGIVTTPVAVH
jgi:alpha-tubulin suppressor-like RCC1 family protein